MKIRRNPAAVLAAIVAAVSLFSAASGQQIDPCAIPGQGGGMEVPACLAERVPVWAPDVFGGYASTHVVIRVRPGAQVSQGVDGRWTVRSANDASAAAPQPADRKAAARGIQPAMENPAIDPIAQLLAHFNVQSITPGFAIAPANPALAAWHGLDRYYLVNVPAGTNTPALADGLRQFADVIEVAELDGIGGAAAVPNDTHFSQQYSMLNTGQIVSGVTGVVGADIKATQAWDISTGSADVIVAIIDSGVNQHVELSGRLLQGFNTVTGTTDTSDGCPHGTHVAGIAAAMGNNAQGVAGVAWNVKVLPVRVLAVCNGNETDAASGIVWAVDHGADIANISLQYYSGTSIHQSAVEYAYDSGMIIVAASGNNQSVVAFPARWPQTIAVAATDNRDVRWPGSNQGPQVNVSAPGWNILSSINTSGYGLNTGTSMASPHVAGVAALMRSLDATISFNEVLTILQNTAQDVGPFGFDNGTGWGRINAHAALVQVQNQLPTPGDLNGDGSVGPADLGVLLGSWGTPGCAGASPCSADINNDGSVGPADLGILLGNWG